MHFRNHREGDFLVAHFQGGTANSVWAAVMQFADTEVSVPANVGIVTFATRNAHQPLFVGQLEERKIAYLNPAADLKLWRNPMKLSLAAKALAELSTEYALVADGNDVMLAKPLDDIVQRFEAYGKAVLFGATKTNHPPIYIDQLKDRDWLGEFRFLNAGTCFGRRENLLAFYRRAADLADEIPNPWESEQLIVRHVFAEDVEEVGFDWRCSIFQTFAKANIEQIDDVVRIS